MKHSVRKIIKDKFQFLKKSFSAKCKGEKPERRQLTHTEEMCNLCKAANSQQ